MTCLAKSSPGLAGAAGKCCHEPGRGSAPMQRTAVKALAPTAVCPGLPGQSGSMLGEMVLEIAGATECHLRSVCPRCSQFA